MQGKPTNPLKSHGESKKTTKEMADQADPTAVRRKGMDTVSEESNADEKSPPGNRHPSNRGGVKADDAAEPPDRPGTKRSGPSPADEPSSPRTGTAPDKGAGSTRRSGKTDNDRQV
jgi:hypothetical protein